MEIFRIFEISKNQEEVGKIESFELLKISQQAALSRDTS
jgi:hypothetical protein